MNTGRIVSTDRAVDYGAINDNPKKYNRHIKADKGETQSLSAEISSVKDKIEIGKENPPTKSPMLSAFSGSLQNKTSAETAATKTAPKIFDAKMAGLTIGMAMEYGLAVTGAATYLHEMAHAVMVNKFYTNPAVMIQVDGIDNMRNLIQEPSLKNLGNVLSGHDVNNDGAAGVTRYSYGEGLNDLGQSLGEDKVRAVIAAAGSISEQIPVLMGFAAGYKLRKKFPAAGYSLMTLAGVHHLSTASYPISALWTTSAQRPGHDWAVFAEKTGIHPAITAAVFAASLPALGAVMWLSEKRQESKEKDKEAVARLISQGGITSQEIDAVYENYKGKDKMEKVWEKTAEVLDLPAESLIDNKQVQKDLRSAVNELKKENGKFTLFLAEQFRDRVDLEKEADKKKNAGKKPAKISSIKQDLKRAWNNDKIGTGLTAGTIAGSAAIMTKSAAGAAAAATGSSALGAGAAAMTNIVPGVSLIGTAAAAWRAGKTLQNPDAGKIDKASSVSLAAFSSLATAGIMIPGLGVPFMIAGVGGMLGTLAAKKIAEKISG